MREGASTLEGRRVRAGWLATCPDDISTFMSLWLCLLVFFVGRVGVFNFFLRMIGWVDVWVRVFFFAENEIAIMGPVSR